MKRMIAAAVVVIGLAASAQAQHGPVHGVAAPGCAGCATGPASYGPRVGMPVGFHDHSRGCKECDPKFGLNPFFKKLMFWKKDTSCGTCGRLFGGFCKGKNCATGQFNPYPDGVPGTLVFPYNPYIRSPRDWYEK